MDGANDASDLYDAPAADAGALAACAAYAAADCERYEACYPNYFRGRYGTVDICRRRTIQFCPNEFSAPGTALTPGLLASCAPLVAAQTCSEWLTDRLPAPCRFKGTMSNGAACEYDSQCQSNFCSKCPSGVCNGPLSWCGVCRTRVREGEICDPHEKSCELGLTCGYVCSSDDAGACTQTRAWRCGRRRPLGSACADYAECAHGLYCNNGQCTKEKSAGESCRSPGDVDCDFLSQDLYCGPKGNDAGYACLQSTYASVGQTCDLDKATFCTASAPCSADGGHANAGTCIAPGADGEPCVLGFACQAPAFCVNGTCQGPVDPSSCR
jgi:hypothetical protein